MYSYEIVLDNHFTGEIETFTIQADSEDHARSLVQTPYITVDTITLINS